MRRQSLAEKRAAALALDPALLAKLLGTVELRELLDPDVIEQTHSELQRTFPVARPALLKSLRTYCGLSVRFPTTTCPRTVPSTSPSPPCTPLVIV